MKIKLGGKRGGFAIVSKTDYDCLSKYSWQMDEDGYVRGTIANKTIRMHRFIMNINDGKPIDHINGIRHDNRRINLRLSTGSKNSQNRNKQKNTSSKYRGVSYYTAEKKYRAKLILNKQTVYLGLHTKEINAAEAVDMYLVHNSGHDHIKLNFPEKKNEYMERKYIPYVSKKNKTIYRGLTKKKYGYLVTIRINKKDIRIGSSKNLVIAAKMFDKYVVNNKIPHRKLNFPDDYPEYDPKVIKTTYETVDDKTIKLVNKSLKDHIVLIDKDDYDKVKNYSWAVNKGYVNGYVDGNNIRISRLLLNVSDSTIYIDHINNNRLDNTRTNLRISDAVKNGRNKKKIHNTRSKYIGLFFHGKGWNSTITYNGKCIYIGRDVKEIHAARRRDLYILDNYPDEHYKMNFEWTNKDIVKWKKTLNTNIEYYADTIFEISKDILRSVLDNNLQKVGKSLKVITNTRKQKSIDEMALDD